MSESADQVTRLLQSIGDGDAADAADALLPLVYEELRSRAGRLLSGERRNHTLQRTALVHEAYLKLVRGDLSFRSRRHFFNAAALAMRRILVNHAVERKALKRGGARQRLSLEAIDEHGVETPDALDWIDLDEALNRLAQVSPRQHQVVMLRFFSGRTEAEVAEMLEVSPATVERDWAMARAWLYRAMNQKS
jgi:RNA polymerase sigma factor (TIGR02999 family)